MGIVYEAECPECGMKKELFLGTSMFCMNLDSRTELELSLIHISDLFYFDSKLVFALVGAFGSIISQIGDLAASAIKRNHDIKDYGDIIPGHGGILDRFDSIIFVAPVVYYLLQLLIKIG